MPQNPIPARVQKVRTDLSEWVWHFVKREPDSLGTLKNILNSRKLIGGRDKHSKMKVICLTEAPAYEFARQSDVLAQNNYARLSDYGVGFRKRWLYERGGLPVIYQPQSFFDDFPNLPPEYRFRHVQYNPESGIDYTWQREWRVGAAELKFTPADAVVIVPSFNQADGLLYDIEQDGDCVDGELVNFPSIIPRWSFIAVDQLNKITDLNDNKIELSVRDDLPE